MSWRHPYRQPMLSRRVRRRDPDRRRRGFGAIDPHDRPSAESVLGTPLAPAVGQVPRGPQIQRRSVQANIQRFPPGADSFPRSFRQRVLHRHVDTGSLLGRLPEVAALGNQASLRCPHSAQRCSVTNRSCIIAERDLTQPNSLDFSVLFDPLFICQDIDGRVCEFRRIA